MTARDPRIDPQPGDKVRAVDGQMRRVIWRDGEMLWCETGQARYRMRVNSWQQWCTQSGAESTPEPKLRPARSRSR